MPAASRTVRYFNNAGAGAGNSKNTTIGKSSGPSFPVGCSQMFMQTSSPAAKELHAAGA